MTDPVLLLDSTVLVAYEHDLTRRAQALVLEALADGQLMVTAALSLAVGLHRAGRGDPGTRLADLRPRWPAQRAAVGTGRDGSRHRR